MNGMEVVKQMLNEWKDHAEKSTWKGKCCFCGAPITLMTANNPWPLMNEAEGHKCCPACNANKVIPARMKLADDDNTEYKEDYK